jgi:hypothetical protein
MANNLLSYGGNLDILHRSLTDEPVDLVYQDPPSRMTRPPGILGRPHHSLSPRNSMGDTSYERVPTE